MFIAHARTLGRFTRVMAALLFIVTMVPTPGSVAAETTPDFSAALLMPWDLEAAGVPGYGVDTGRMMSMSQARLEPLEDGWIHELYDVPGGLRVHSLDLVEIAKAEVLVPEIIYTSIVNVFAGSEEASEAYDVHAEVIADSIVSEPGDFPGLGDQALMAATFEGATDDGDFHLVKFTFQIDALVAHLVVYGYDMEPDLEAAETLAERLAEKLTSVLEDGEIDGVRTPNLATMIPRYEQDEVTTYRSHYCAIEGVAVPRAFFPLDFEATAFLTSEFGMVDTYCSLQRLIINEDDGEVSYIDVRPFRFARSSGAADAIQHMISRRTDNYPEIEMDEVDPGDVPFEVDEAHVLTFSGVVDGLDWDVTEMLVRDGRTVFSVILDGISAPDLDVMLALMADIADCMEEPCVETFELPAVVLDYLDEQIELYEEM